MNVKQCIVDNIFVMADQYEEEECVILESTLQIPDGIFVSIIKFLNWERCIKVRYIRVTPDTKFDKN